MYVLATVLILIVSLLIIIIVLVQDSKGGGLASNFSSSNQVMGVKKTSNFLEKATWTLAISLLAFSLIAAMALPGKNAQKRESAIQEQIQNVVTQTNVPQFPSEGEAVQVQGQEQQPEGAALPEEE